MPNGRRGRALRDDAATGARGGSDSQVDDIALLVNPIRIHLRAPADDALVPGLPVRLGVPFPRAVAHRADELAVVDAFNRRLPWQGEVLERWSDRSIRWMLVDFLVRDTVASGEFHLVRAADVMAWPAVEADPLHAEAQPGCIVVRCGSREFVIEAGGSSLLGRVQLGGQAAIGSRGVELKLRGGDGAEFAAKLNRVALERAGPVRVDVVAEGEFSGALPCPLEFRARWAFVAGGRDLSCDLMIRNPRAARHPGGLWDLGDPGSWNIGDLSVRVSPASAAARLHWGAQVDDLPGTVDPATLCVYQDSSGGERWASPNHLDADGKLGVSFRGYQVRRGTPDAYEVLKEGRRAQPWLRVDSAVGWMSASIDAFWQNFPKALRWHDNALEVGLFPNERRAPVELQGGEQKRHTFRLAFGLDDDAPPLRPEACGPGAWVDPVCVEASGAIPGFVATLGDFAGHETLVGRIVDGPDSFESRRELIDEYGWRNFGDLYADHEAVNVRDASPFVSHYNNQYDFVLGAAVQALRTRDERWMRLATDAARHTVDIDIYHTEADRPAYNGGLFWHTDHYLPACTATHRTYSRTNSRGREYGGGPGNEHNYASGLLLHHLITGDPDSREAVIGLADWVVAMDDGASTLLGLVDNGPTGAASRTANDAYHGPGRGAGNSIATLLDAYRLTRRRAYVCKAEELVQRCIHPGDDVSARQLDDPERRWSYLVFLQTLGKYLDFKHELGETDYAFQYARESLLRYASWMLEHEVPYGEALHKVEFPTETWPAHDIRKCHVLHLAAYWDDGGLAPRYRAAAASYYDRCLADLAGFETRHLTRPLVILCVFGHWHAYYMQKSPDGFPGLRVGIHGYDFGSPLPFVPQRARIRASLGAKWRIARREVRRLVSDRLARARSRPEERRR